MAALMQITTARKTKQTEKYNRTQKKTTTTVYRKKKQEYKTKPNRKQLCLSVCVLHFRATTQNLHVSWIKRLLQFVVVVILVLQF